METYYFWEEGENSVQSQWKEKAIQLSTCCENKLSISLSWPDGGIRYSMKGSNEMPSPPPPRSTTKKLSTSEPALQSFGVPPFVSHLHLRRKIKSKGVLGKACKVSPHHHHCLGLPHSPAQEAPAFLSRQQIWFCSSPRTNYWFTRNTGTKEQVKRDHGDTISEIQNVRKCTEQMTSFFNNNKKWQKQTKKRKQ
jgi:hypothetical protein